MPSIDLTDEDIDELRQAISAYREDLVRMARLMEDARYLNALPWVQAFGLRLSAIKESQT